MDISFVKIADSEKHQSILKEFIPFALTIGAFMVMWESEATKYPVFRWKALLVYGLPPICMCYLIITLVRAVNMAGTNAKIIFPFTILVSIISLIYCFVLKAALLVREKKAQPEVKTIDA